MVKVNNRITMPTDAILGREPSTMLQSVMNEELIRKLNSELARKKAREEYRRANILRPEILTISDEDIDKAIVALEASKPTNLVQDNRTEKLRKASKKEFDKRYLDEQEKKRLDLVDEIMSSSTDYIPIVGSLLRAGQYNYARDHLGWKYANNRYGLSPMISSALDVVTIPFGIGVKALASSYAGGMAGKYVGDKYFDNPHVGLFIGTLVGHPTYNVASKASKEFQFKNILNLGIKRTKLINVPVEHVSSNGITKGSALNVGEEGIHLSSPGSVTTPRVELYLLNLGKFPFIRTGTWAYSTNTKPVSVKDLGYFGKGFNPDFDAKVNNGVTNFSYTNNFEGLGNTSYLTIEPSFGLLLSKNTMNKNINWRAHGTIVPEGIRLVDETLTPYFSKNILDRYLGKPVKIWNSARIISHPEFGDDFVIKSYSLNGREYNIGVNSFTGKVIYSIPENPDWQLLEGSLLDGSLNELIKLALDNILNSRHNFIESLPDNEIKDVVRSLGIRHNINPSEKFDNSLSIKDTRLGDIFQSKIKDDILNVYLSDNYITRYMESLGISPENRDFRELLKKRVSHDLNKTYDLALPISYRAEANNGGVSNASVDHFRRPVQFRYGINGNTLPEYILNDWTSILFHEFGHNIFRDTTPFSKYIQGHSAKLRRNYPLEFTKPEYILQSLDPNTHVGYLSNPNEFRLRIMEGVRYGIKEGLTPEEIYKECNILGFTELKSYFKKEYLIKMLGLMLGTVPVIFKSNDKAS